MLPERRSIERIGDTAVRFEQTAGGRTGLPGRPSWSRAALYWRVHTPLVWTTLALTLHRDGTAHGELVGASPFPRHGYTTAARRGLPARSTHAPHGAARTRRPWSANWSPRTNVSSPFRS
jgi:hypothetical protein